MKPNRDSAEILSIPQNARSLLADSAPLADQFAGVRAATERICEPLETEDYVVQSMADVSPAKWHLAHTSWFWETFLLTPYQPGFAPYHPRYAFLFNSYYNTVGRMHYRPHRGLLSRPTVAEVYAYRRSVDEKMAALLADPPGDAKFLSVFRLGLNHEQQHQELMLTDIKHVFSINPLAPVYRERPNLQSAPVPPVEWIENAGGDIEIGYAGDAFAFDNERPRHAARVAPFAIASRPVTCGEFSGFIADGGYERADLWLSDAWFHLKKAGWNAPLYWERDGERWTQFTLAGVRADRPGRAGLPRQLLRGRRLRAVGRRKASARGRVGGGRRGSTDRRELRRERSAAPGAGGRIIAGFLRRRLGVDGEPLYRLPALQAAAWRLRRIQREVHVQPDGPSRRLVRDADLAYPNDLPQLLPARRTLAVPGLPAGAGRGGGPMTTAESAARVGDERSSDFMREVLEGLGGPRKWLPCKYFYDEHGAELFEQITRLDAYYPTRTELAIMKRFAGEMAEAIGADAQIIELGAGSGLKTRTLLDAIQSPAGYLPVDISPDYLFATAEALAAEYPSIEVVPILADFTAPFSVPAMRRRPARRVVYFPGSTLGNFDPDDAVALLRTVASTAGPGGGLLIGLDRKKDVDVLHAAYDDPQGVTARFNLNLLRRINDELGADFRLERFRHGACWNPERGRVEIHLTSVVEQIVHVGERSFHFRAGESIHTENSHKYDAGDARKLAARAGFRIARDWTDDRDWFSVQFWEVAYP